MQIRSRPAFGLVLVHSPLTGPGVWRLVADQLVAARGYDVVTADLTATLRTGPPFFAHEVQAVADCVSGSSAVLVGHSGAGSLLPAVGDVAAGVRGYVYVDAGLPTPGRSWMQTMPEDLVAYLRESADPQGWMPPWCDWWGEDGLAGLLPDPGLRAQFAADCPRLPLAMFDEVHPDIRSDRGTPAAYLQLSEAYQDQAAKARSTGWPVAALSSHHLALLTDPQLIAGSLESLIGQLGNTGHT
ncbi:MAG TPA: alpha/beta hydrolase [Streptosporangiaceae bacterium]|nr:alpha/beta hydrolase [Streptosporangiaceae bacterium]